MSSYEPPSGSTELPLRVDDVMEHDIGFKAAVEEAKAGFEEGGVPIGACLVSQDGKVLGKGHNMRVQRGSATLHVGLCFLDNLNRHAIQMDFDGA